jgi:sortase A
MPDRRTVDELSIEELEQVLALRKRQARMERLRRLEHNGRKRAGVSPIEDSIQRHEQDADASLAYESFIHEDKPGKVPWRDRSLRDKLLFAVEISAAVGLFAILVYAALALRDINLEAAAAQESLRNNLPTPTTTPIIGVVVLPGGHTPPINGQQAQPNYDEFPAHLRPLAEAQFSGPVIEPTTGPTMAERIQVPAIDLDAVIVQGDGWEQLIKGVGQHLGTANPGESGNMVLSAHNDIYNELFRRLPDLEIGDEIIIYTRTQQFTYKVVNYHIVEPTAVEVMLPSTDAVVTLISCYPYKIDTMRYVVVGELVK